MSISLLEGRAALVILDLQHVVMARDTEPHTTHTVLERSVRLADAFRASNRPVILVHTTGTTCGRTDRSQRGGRAPAPPDGSDVLDPRLAADVHHIATKQAWGAMHAGADLPQILVDLGVVQVVLTGIATSMAVESTARSAHENGYHVVLVVDAMSDLDALAHRHSTERIFPQLGETGTTDEIVRLLKRAPAGA